MGMVVFVDLWVWSSSLSTLCAFLNCLHQFKNILEDINRFKNTLTQCQGLVDEVVSAQRLDSISKVFSNLVHSVILPLQGCAEQLC